MKKLLLSALTLATVSVSMGQAFFNQTTFRGAFAPAPTPMWTNTWTEWDPQNKVYPAPTMTVTGNITANTTWATGQTILLSSTCFVKNNAVLTIQPGVVIRGDKSVTGAGLFITTGAKLIANGTVNQPIVFTSDQAPGARGLGDWGGVILMGLAPNNSPAGTGTLTNPAGTNYIEGLPVSADTQYGGSNPADNSGSMQYCRIEFGGYIYQPNKEINGLTFGAVGNGTTIDYVQVSFSNDDSFEWFGGNVNCKHLVAYRGLDDDWDTDNGYSGYVQYCLGVRDPQISDNPAVSTSEGFESDNDPNGTTATPLTSAIFSNVTDIGPLRGVLTATYASGFRRGARIRRNSNLKIYNSLIMDHATRGLYVDGSLCETNANSGALKFMNNIVAGYGQRAMETGTFGILANPNLWVKTTNNNDTLNSTAGILVNPYQYFTPDYRPAAAGVAATGASFSDPTIAPLTLFTGLAEINKQIGSIALAPNPTNGVTTLMVDAISILSLNVSIYDVTGKLVSTPVKDQNLSVGENRFNLNTTDLNSGVYFVTLTTANGKETVKLIVTK
ncbi:MAG: T9SS type A sorting domain-containing protein [Bacteroidetes bacterium]|nr:T9SS type A sorting domain-containing protein [Bacteroidota bacterium]